MDRKALIESLIEQTNNLPDLADGELDALKKRAVMIVTNIFPDTKGYGATILNTRFYTMATNIQFQTEIWNEGKRELLNFFKTLKEEIELFNEMRELEKEEIKQNQISNKVFIVHGQDEEMKQSVARVLDKLKLEPIILHEQPDIGRTVIEKFSDYSDVGFAVVLLSPDDLAYSKEESHENAKLRARQNVIFELGFFIGKLGRARVLVLHREDDKFEMPSDYFGVIYKPYRKGGDWSIKLAKELKDIGYDIDLSKIP